MLLLLLTHRTNCTQEKAKNCSQLADNRGVSNYDAANMLVIANRFAPVRSFRRVYTASYNENPVARNDAKFP